MADSSVNPLQMAFNTLAQHPLAQSASTTLKRWQQNQQDHDRKMFVARRPPRIVVLPRTSAPLAAVLPGDGVAEQVLTTGLVNFLNLYNSALVVRLVLTWFPEPPEFIAQPLSTICDPYLNLFRGIIPPLGGSLDFSPILAFVTLNFFSSAAAALPAEVGADGRMLAPVRPANQLDGAMQWMQPSRYQRMWAKRVQAERMRRAEDRPGVEACKP